MQAVFRVLLLWIAALMVVAAPARAQMTTSDTMAMRAVVEAQLEAFANDRDSEAYSYAAPLVQRVFPSVDRFMAMVKGGYQPVYRNTSREFLESGADAKGRPTVRVRLTGLDGRLYEALYVMERQPDGSWKIAGCALINIPGLDA